MSTFIGVESTVTYGTDSRAWLWGPHGTEPGTTPSIVLDISSFTAATHYPNGQIPSGTVLGKITASGHETTDTDPGTSTSKGDYSCEAYILAQDHYQIELLTNLDKLPEAGALVIAAFPKPFFGSGFPARVFAILP